MPCAWNSNLQKYVAGLYALNFNTLTRSFVFKNILLWLSGENGSFEVIYRIIIQYIVNVCRLTVVEGSQNRVTGKSTGK